MRIKKLLCIFAHPDDESFGPGGTIAKCARSGVEVCLLCTTYGEAGQNNKSRKSKPVFKERKKELKKAAEILGIKKVSFLGFLDGEISNHDIGYLTDKIAKKVKKIKPQVLLTFDLAGHYGHLDHIAVSLSTTFAFYKTEKLANGPSKLYYQALPKSVEKILNREGNRLFFGVEDDKIAAAIDIRKTWETKKQAIMAHQTQKADWQKFLPIMEKLPKKEYFVLAAAKKGKRFKLPEIDLFEGIG